MRTLLKDKYFSMAAAEGGSNAGGGGGSGPAGSSPAGSGSATAAAGATTPPPAAPAAASAPSDWTSGLSEDQRGYVGNKGFKTPTDVLESYRGLEKLMGAPKDRLVTLPERFYDDQGKLTAEGRAIRERIGAPKEAKEYNLAAPKEGGDPKLMEHFRGVFHELGLPKADAEKITSSWNDYVAGQSTAFKEAAAQALKDQQAQLSKEWGAATEQNTKIARDAVRAMGIDATKIDALAQVLGHAETMKLFHKLGTQVQEAPFIGGQKPDAILEPVNAKAQIKELMQDRNFGKALESGDKDARAKWERLHQMAFVGEHRL